MNAKGAMKVEYMSKLNKLGVLGVILCLAMHLSAQRVQSLSALNPAFFLYDTGSVFIRQPEKHNNGANIIVPDPQHYPWEAKLENGMPNVLKDSLGNLSIYVSCFLVHSPVPYSKVGAFVYTNRTSDVTQWNRPDAGLYWYNPQGVTVDQKISPEHRPGFQSSNIVAVDIESLGIYEDTDADVTKPIKLIYLPQREEENRLIAGYEMDKLFTDKGILTGFSQMKVDRLQAQKKYWFAFINGDTHMNYLKQDSVYYMVSRINAKRSSLFPGETLPFPSPDPRIRYRRETVTCLGPVLESGHYGIDVALDMSTRQWEPYSLQPFRLPGFETDVWWGLVTAFGTRADAQVANRQRTELAFSNNGINWYYVKSGVPFIDNGTDPQSDDHGCINTAKPVLAGKYAENPNDLLYFYAASKQLHVSERNSGISLAVGKYGKWAGLNAGVTSQTFYSMIPTSENGITKRDLVRFSLYSALGVGARYTPQVLADVVQDPREKTLSQLDSYVAVSMYNYDESKSHGQGMLLGGAMGSSVQGTSAVSDDYEDVGNINGINVHDKNLLFNYLKACSKKEPTRVISIKDDMNSIPIVMETIIKNATFYGMRFQEGSLGTGQVLNTRYANATKGLRYWNYRPPIPDSSCYTHDFSTMQRTPNCFIPTDAERGTIAVEAIPQLSSTGEDQTLLRMYGEENDDNCISILYTSGGSILYRLMMHGTDFASMEVSPPFGNRFDGHSVIITVEALKAEERRYGRVPKEDVTVIRVACPDLGFEQTIQQPILWTWKHSEGAVTPSDSANARAFAYVQFSSFAAGMKRLTIGGADERCSSRFVGKIMEVEVAERLPSEGDVFWQSRLSAVEQKRISH